MITMQTIKLKAQPRGCVFFCTFKMDKMADSGQFVTKDGHIGRDFGVGT